MLPRKSVIKKNPKNKTTFNLDETRQHENSREENNN
jgi:hypothetical protein